MSRHALVQKALMANHLLNRVKAVIPALRHVPGGKSLFLRLVALAVRGLPDDNFCAPSVFADQFQVRQEGRIVGVFHEQALGVATDDREHIV